MKKRSLRDIPYLVLVLTWLLSACLGMGGVGVAAAVYTHYLTVNVYNNGSTEYSVLPVLITLNNSQLAELGLINASGLDTSLQEGATDRVYMVADGRLGVYSDSFAGYQNRIYYYRLGDSPGQTAFPIVVGVGGCFTVSDSASLELGDNFTVSYDGFIDTTQDQAHLILKGDVFHIHVDGSGGLDAHANLTVDEPVEYSSTSDGEIQATGSPYATVRTAAVGTVDDSGSTMSLGQSKVVGTYWVYRGFVFFDTSDIPDDAEVISATLSLYGNTDESDDNFNIVVQSGMPTRPTDPLAVGDYLYTHYSGDGGSLTTAGFSTVGYNDITLNEDGRGWINVTGVTKFALRSDEDISGSAPVGLERVNVFTSDEAGTTKDPKLAVTWRQYTEAIATNVSVGEHTVEVSANITHLSISVDSGEEISTPLLAPISDTSDVWYFAGQNSTSYLNSLKISVNGSQKLWIEPVSMVDPTNLPDRSGNGNTGTIVWGTNPASLEILVGALTTVTSYVPPGGTEGEDVPDLFIPPTQGPTTDASEGDLVDMPMYAVFSNTASDLGWSTATLYGVMMIIPAIAMGYGGLVATGSIFVGIILAAAVLGVAAGTPVIPWWMPVIMLLIAVFGIYVSRQT